MEFEVIQSKMIPIGQISENRGQIPGVPANPRKISLSKLRKLEQSIRDYPDMVCMREVLVYPVKNKFVIVCGNMRFQALKKIRIEYVPCKVIPSTATPDQIRAYMLRDNTHFGEWEFGETFKFDFAELELAQMPVPAIDIEKMIKESRSRLPWHSANLKAGGRSEKQEQKKICEPLCDLNPKPCLYMRDEMAFSATFKKSVEGMPLSQIKTEGNVELFAQSAVSLIRKILRFRVGRDWALVTTPCRRHKENNFSVCVCERLSSVLGIPFHAGFAEAKNRDRIKPVFFPQYDIPENNIILYDDIFTTGTSIRAMLDLLSKKNILTVVGINNN